ncbi:MAG: hypothetical protein ABI605_16735 [Rhizobacter sp.]
MNDDFITAAAQSLYGKSEPLSPPAQSAAPASPDAGAIYAKPAPYIDKTVTVEKLAERAADPDRAMFDNTQSMFKGTGLDTIEGLDHQAAAEVFRDLGAEPADAARLVTTLAQVSQATAADLETWITETSSRISPEDMALGREFLKTEPRALAFIQRHPDLAFEPDTCRRVIELAKAARLKGRK